MEQQLLELPVDSTRQMRWEAVLGWPRMGCSFQELDQAEGGRGAGACGSGSPGPPGRAAWAIKNRGQEHRLWNQIGLETWSFPNLMWVPPPT